MWNPSLALLIIVTLSRVTTAEDDLLATFGLDRLQIVSDEEAANVRGQGYANSAGTSLSAFDLDQVGDMTPADGGAIAESHITAAGVYNSGIEHVTTVQLESNFSTAASPHNTGLGAADLQLRSTGYASSLAY